MPTWSEILREIGDGGGEYDLVRRKYLAALNQHTQRNTILYATCWTQKPGVDPQVLSVTDEDMQGLMEMVHGLSGPNLDIILHSPGGSLPAAEAFVTYLRSKFEHIRAIVPHVALSAATMIALASDEIVLGKHSFLGPIDPQFTIPTPLGQRMVPAQAVLAQFAKAQSECRDPTKIGAWMPMLAQYGPDLLIQCENSSALSQAMVEKWLVSYMFKGNGDGPQKAKQVAEWLGDHDHTKIHGRHIPRSELAERGLRIANLEDDQTLQDLVLSVFHATTLTFSSTAAAKLIENHAGRAFVKQISASVMNMRVPNVPPPEGPPQK